MKLIAVRNLFSLVVIVFVFHSSSQGQSIRRPVAANYIGLGAYSIEHADAFSFLSNQASLAQLKNFAAGVYGERRFLLNELSLYNAAIALPVKPGSFGLKAGYYGFSDYNETQAGLAYGRSLGSKIDIGVQFNYYGIKVAGYGNASAIGFEAGAILHVTDKLNAGVHLSNPVGGKFNKNADEKLPFVYTMGLGYDASDHFFVSAEIEKEEDQPVNVNAGIQYKFLPQLFVRTGISTATSNIWFGAGILIKSLRIDVTAGWHPQLGITPGLLLIFNNPLTNKEKTPE